MTPAVSVVIPSYNQAHFLNAALESLRAQTLRDWEAVVVNNFSDDDTEEVVHRQGDDRITLVNFRNNGIIGASRNLGISRTRAEYVAFLDSDDIWHRTKLERCLSSFRQDADIVTHDLEILRGDTVRGTLRAGPVRRASWESMLFEGNCLTTSATVVRRRALVAVGGFSERADYRTAEDYELWLKLARRGSGIVFLPEILGTYRMHDTGASKAITTHLEAGLAIVGDHFRYLKNPTFFDRLRLRRRRADLFYGAGRRALAALNLKVAKSFFVRALREFPAHLRTYINILLTVRFVSPRD